MARGSPVCKNGVSWAIGVFGPVKWAIEREERSELT